jgi:hypothetical protein
VCIRDIGFRSNSTKIKANDREMNNNQPKEDDWDKKDLRRKKIEEKNSFKEDKNSEPNISHSLKKEFKKKKQETEEEEWEEWERFYNR